MMNKKGYLLIGLIYSLFITNIMSQELKTPTLEDLILSLIHISEPTRP